MKIKNVSPEILINKGMDYLNDADEITLSCNAYSQEGAQYEARILEKGFILVSSETVGRDFEIDRRTYRKKTEAEINSESLQFQMNKLANDFAVKVYVVRDTSMTTGVELIMQERDKQIERYGFTAKHHVDNDEYYLDHQIAEAVIGLLSPEVHGACPEKVGAPEGWDADWFTRMMLKTERERLIIAGALLSAELDRVQLLLKLDEIKSQECEKE